MLLAHSDSCKAIFGTVSIFRMYSNTLFRIRQIDPYHSIVPTYIFKHSLYKRRHNLETNYRYTTPVKMQRSTHYGNNYYVIPSRKIGRNVTAFSYLEYCNIITLEMNSKVAYYCEQPCTVDVYVNGKKFQTTFDVYVVYTDGQEEMQEIKYNSELNADNEKGERDREQVERQKLWCLQNDISYFVRTDNIIMPGDFTIRNMAWLAAKARRYAQTNDIARKIIIAYLKENGGMTIGQLYTSGNLTHKNGLDLLADMYYRGEISIGNIDSEQISNKTEVSV